jgi:anti-sigma factor RsiW
VTCSEFLKELTDYLDDSMDAQTRAELEDHLQWCHNCYVVCNTTKRTIEIYRDSHLYELPEDLRGRLRSAIMSKCHGHKESCADNAAKNASGAAGPEIVARPNESGTTE